MENGHATTAILIAVYATFALDAFSAFCSSPQTTELNAGARTPTLMYWVAMGGGAAVGMGVLGSILDRSIWPLLATGGVAVGFYLLYQHASNRGMAQKGQETESY